MKTRRPVKFVRCVVQVEHRGKWSDVSERMHYLPSAAAALERWREDFPEREHRLAFPG